MWFLFDVTRRHDLVCSPICKGFLCKDDHHQIFPSGIVAQHHLLFSRSMSILNHELQRDIYNIQRPGFFIDDVVPPQPDPLAPLRYVAVYWVGHLKEALTMRDKGTAFGLLHQFMQESFLYWLECLSLMLSIGTAVMTLRNLTDLVVSCFTTSSLAII